MSGFGRMACILLVFGIAIALQSPAGSSAEGPTIEATSGSYGSYVWRPSLAQIGAGGEVAFKSPSTVVPHGVTWKSGPETPSCNGVPIDEEKTSWSGNCTFAQAGSYDFVCTVHPVEMKGSITVSSGEAPPVGPPPPPSPGSSESLLAGPASRALRIAKDQRGARMRGSIALSKAAVGGRLKVELLARRAAVVSAANAGLMRVGRAVRSPLRAGRVSFTVALRRPARRALRRRERLPLRVKVIVTTPSGDRLKLNRRVVLHG